MGRVWQELGERVDKIKIHCGYIYCGLYIYNDRNLIFNKIKSQERVELTLVAQAWYLESGAVCVEPVADSHV